MPCLPFASLTIRSSPTPALPLTFPLLLRLCQAAGGFGDRGRAFAALLATAFYSMARLSSLVPETRGRMDLSRVPLLRDLSLQGHRASIFIKWGKAAQRVQDGFWVPLRAVARSPACPVLLLTRLSRSLKGCSSTCPLFSFATRRGRTGLSFFTFMEARVFLRSLLRGLGLDPAGFSFHSFRRGGCTFAFTGGGGGSLSDLLLLRGWRSRAIDAYYPLGLSGDRAAGVMATFSSTTLPPLPH